MVVFKDRVDAGRQLAEQLEFLRGQDVVVLGLPRGGVPVAAEVAQELDLPLDVIVVRKLGVPYQPELAMGAIGEGGVLVTNNDVLSLARIAEDELAAVERRERAQLESRVIRFRQGRERQRLTGRTALIIDDGIATGSTARVACLVARGLGAAQVVFAVPVGAADSIRDLPGADKVVCLSVPRQLIAVGYHYFDFTPTTDDEVSALLDAADRRQSRRRMAPGGSERAAAPEAVSELPPPADHLPGDAEVVIPVDTIVLELNRQAQAADLARDWFVDHLAPADRKPAADTAPSRSDTRATGATE